jgi:hypothetical protein
MLRVFQRTPDVCGTCRFWQAEEDQEDIVLGECQLHAPEAGRAAADYEAARLQAWQRRRRRTATHVSDWCGSWKWAHAGISARPADQVAC